MIDDKFIDGFIKDAEDVSSKNTNRYFIRGVKQKSIYVKHPKAAWVEDIWCNDFRSILNCITDRDKIFIHWYDLFVGKLMLTIDISIPLYVVCWGGEFYEDPFLYHINWLYDKKTLRLIKKAYIYPKKWAKHPRRFLQQLWWLLNYRKNAQKEFEFKKLTIHRINYLLLHPNNFFESNLIKNIYKTNELCSLPFFYNQNFDSANKLRNPNNNNKINIQIGNSATESNNHVDCINVLKKFKLENIILVIPLSYGAPIYAEFVKNYCQKIFCNKCEFIEKFIPREEYIEKLNEVDIAVMFHNRSQAVGNCITLLTLGKKIYIKSNNPLWQFFQKVGIIVFDAYTIKELSFEEFSKPLTEDQIKSNVEKISNLFSEEKRLEYLSKVLN